MKERPELQAIIENAVRSSLQSDHPLSALQLREEIRCIQGRARAEEKNPELPYVISVPGACDPQFLIAYVTAYAVWNSSQQQDLVDPFLLNIYWQNNQFAGTISSNTEDAHIAMTAATQNGSGQLTATASLVNAPTNSLSLKWMNVGPSTVVFKNNSQTIEVPYSAPTLSSPWPSVQLLETNPTVNSVSFTLKVDVTEQLIVGTDTLEYGPITDVFCGVPAITSISPNVWFAGQSYNIIVTGTGSFARLLSHRALVSPQPI